MISTYSQAEQAASPVCGRPVSIYWLNRKC